MFQIILKANSDCFYAALTDLCLFCDVRTACLNAGLVGETARLISSHLISPTSPACAKPAGPRAVEAWWKNYSAVKVDVKESAPNWCLASVKTIMSFRFSWKRQTSWQIKQIWGPQWLLCTFSYTTIVTRKEKHEGTKKQRLKWGTIKKWIGLSNYRRFGGTFCLNLQGVEHTTAWHSQRAYSSLSLP
jgi:hypothetical protein